MNIRVLRSSVVLPYYGVLYAYIYLYKSSTEGLSVSAKTMVQSISVPSHAFLLRISCEALILDITSRTALHRPTYRESPSKDPISMHATHFSI